MIWLYCVDAKGLEGLLVECGRYLCRPLPCGAVRVGNLVCSRSRFSAEDPLE